MAKIDIKLGLDIAEVNTVVGALQQWRRVQAFNYNGTASTADEKRTAAQEVLRVEGILRQLGVEPDELKKENSGNE